MIENVMQQENYKHNQGLLEDLEESWKNASETYNKLLQEGKDLTFLEDEYNTLRRRTRELKNQLMTKITKASRQLNLPQVQIPTFYGEYEKWPEFKDVFTSLVHSEERLTEIEKLKYLKTHTRGDAAQAIQNITMKAENYNAAWETLQKRYENKRLITKKIIEKIYDYPKIRNESAQEMKRFYDTMEACVKSLQSLQYDIEGTNPFFNEAVTRKWDNETIKEFEKSLENPHEVSTTRQILEFMKRRYETLEGYRSNQEDTSFRNSSKTNFKQEGQQAAFKKTIECMYCKQEHKLLDCEKFRKNTPQERGKFVKEKGLCEKCLKHRDTNTCTNEQTCKKCNRSHHTLLHWDAKLDGQKEKQTRVYTNHASIENNPGLLATALVQVQNGKKQPELLRVLIDSGAQVSFITEEAAQRIEGPKKPINAQIVGLGGDQPKAAHWKIEAKLMPRMPSKFYMNTELIILKKLTKAMPHEKIDTNEEEWGNMLLADPTFDTPGPIEAILGVAEYGQIIKEGLKRSNNGLVAQNTELGWILTGNIHQKIQKVNQVFTAIQEGSQEDLTKFWEMEEIPKQEELSQEEEICEEIFQENTKRNKDGSYTVKTPFKKNIETLGKSRAQAAATVIQLERKFQQNPKLKKEYAEFMEEYETLRHMRPVPASQEGEGKYYIPHQAVIREDSTTTKLRVVFDASSKTSSGISLNQAMYAGPKLQQDLSDILIRWRTHRIALSDDIEKMYRQIRIWEQEKTYHRILWRTNLREPLKEYELETITYGTTAAPYLAIRTLLRLPEKTKITEADEEVRKIQISANIATTKVNEEVTQFSSLTRLIRVISYGQRFVKNCLQPDNKKVEHPTCEELQTTTITIVKLTQKNCFATEIRDITDTGTVKKTSKIANLNPFIEKEETHPSKWPMAKIQEVIKGKDEKVRVGNVVKAISNIIPLKINEEQKQPKLKTGNGKKNVMTIILMMLIAVATKTEAKYSITHPAPGIYVEKIGHAKIERGTFRIEIQHDMKQMDSDLRKVDQVVEKMDQLCKQASKLFVEIQCSSLVNHIKEQKKELQWIKTSISGVHTRQKRGMLGKLLTSVFGVNDEVYQDIETLDKNQKELIRASDHQTKFMLSALSSFNETERRVYVQLEHFKIKLDQGIQAIEQMNRWYATVDENKLSINVLNSYQMATNYVSEITTHYLKLLNVYFQRGNLYDLISITKVQEIIQQAKSKLPANIDILPAPIIKTSVRSKGNKIHIYSHFVMAEWKEFTILQTTPIPLKVQNNAYWMLETSEQILAIEYNTQLFFEMTNEELKECISIEQNKFVCSPTAVRNIETNPNCIIDEIYKKEENPRCNIVEQEINTVIWKELYMENTWMFISPNKSRVGVICNGVREDIILNSTGIIQISQECVIKSKQIILTPKRAVGFSVLETYIQPVDLVMNTTIEEQFKRKHIKQEPVIKAPEVISRLKETEENIQKELHEDTWRKIKLHAGMISGSTAIVIIMINVIMYVGYVKWSKQKELRKNHEEAGETEMKLLQNTKQETKKLRRPRFEMEEEIEGDNSRDSGRPVAPGRNQAPPGVYGGYGSS